ncbi:prion-like-(Q/N-rich) domain-bearing protein 25 isoform X2 [Mytilus californianus]|uniref:prion-like-(Q/N-rich) domain-bearing protein 25 isoform X2 n=1 Tax=Mytilus californianus TaxID=6549 RepID=UPI002245F965|nr:prion-like-(Q/N-rich) domain-bearing protein 25 isoform X2 [Mytilus californianus]
MMVKKSVKKSVQLVICLLYLITIELCSAVNVDEACQNGNECSVPNSVCTGGTCQCAGTHYKASVSSCIQKIATGAACTAVGQCSDANAECANNLCTCKTGYFKSTNNICTIKVGFGGVCVTSIGDGTCLYSLNCTADKCQCATPANQFFDSTVNTCKQKIALEATCTPGPTDQCLDASAECKTDTDNANKCLCKTTHYKDVNGACVAKVGFGGVCVTSIGDGTCLYSLNCTADKCQCATPANQFFDSTVNTCKQKIALEATCTPVPTDQCLDASAECKADSNNANKCLCKTTHYKDVNGACVAKVGFGGVCVTSIGDGTCLYSLKCTADKCQCDSPTNQFFDSTDNTCKQKIALNLECTIEKDKPCAVSMAVCKQHGSGPNKCMCNSDSYPSINTCLARKLHDIICMENGHVNECVDNAECKKVNDVFKCQCKNGADENGKCNGVTVTSPNLLLTIVCVIGTIVYMSLT